MAFTGAFITAAVAALLAVAAGFQAVLPLHQRKTPAQQGDEPRLLPWKEAEEKAKATVAQLTEAERDQLLSGLHFTFLIPDPGYYTGNIDALPRLHVPALKMQDAANGFRTALFGTEGTSTCWPSMLALASTWDEALVKRVATAIAREFKGKGANVILGPSVNVHRVARGGRNFEYLSGEDPHLGARLVKAYVGAVQDERVMAVVKHFAFNEQETRRDVKVDVTNSIVDEKTAWELYYPPFQAAVDVGAGSFMCSYNRVNGTHACQNPELLRRDLKDRMGFKGFVMSDWGAARSAGDVPAGLDMEQPGKPSVGVLAAAADDRTSTYHLSAEALHQVDSAAVDEAAVRVLTSMYRLKLDEEPGCAPPCFPQLLSNQAVEEHRALAQEAAAKSVVLLSNDGVLPLDPQRVKTIAVFGPAAAAKPHVLLPAGDYYAGGGSGHVASRHTATPLESIQHRAAKAGVSVLSSSSLEPEVLARIASKADAVVFIAGATTTEGSDRASLELDQGADVLIEALSGLKPTVVLLQIPGAVLTPWRSKVAASAALFLGGEATGPAWASVLFGDVSPTGKLALMLPESEADTIQPSDLPDVPYSEGVFTSYRSPTFKAAFAFGHGLSFTQFKYGQAEAVGQSSVRVSITNIGGRPGAEVAQAYLEFPAAADQPRLLLRGFRRTSVLQPGETEEVSFDFEQKDLSTYSVAQGRWVPQDVIKVHVGSSSADIRGIVQLRG